MESSNVMFCFHFQVLKYIVYILYIGNSPNTFDKTVSQKYGSLLESGFLSDIVLAIGERSFPAHKSILASQSPVFAAMFSHNELNEAKDGRVQIVDISVEVMPVFLRYIYTGEIEQIDVYAAELFEAADKVRV